MNHDKNFEASFEPLSTGLLKDYYQILNIDPAASPKEIREAYFRLKNTYNNNNQALYSLLGNDDLSETLSDIELAYTVLNDDRQRLAYDTKRRCGREAAGKLANEPTPIKSSRPSEALAQPTPRLQGAEGVNIEARRHEPARFGASGGEANEVAFSGVAVTAPAEEPSEGRAPASNAQVLFTYNPPKPKRLIATGAQAEDIQKKIAEAIADGDPADGNLYKKIRLIVGIDKDELQEHIKISIGYIDHLEQNRFDLLPQPVYVKGFLKSYLKYLGVADCDRLVKAYSEKFTAWFDQKHSS